MSSTTQDPIETLVGAAGHQPTTETDSICSNDLEKKLTEQEEPAVERKPVPKSDETKGEQQGDESKDGFVDQPASPSPPTLGASGQQHGGQSAVDTTSSTQALEPSSPPQTITASIGRPPPLPPIPAASLSSSLIFERNVQDSSSPAVPTTEDFNGAIPAHIHTDDLIPSVLEASSIALTTLDLDPDDVEIVTHVAHQPAAAVTHAISTNASSTSVFHTQPPLSPASSVYNDMRSSSPVVSSTSAAGISNSPDPRRLSFISFADVVQGEQAESSTSPRPASSSGFFVPPHPSASPSGGARTRSPVAASAAAAFSSPGSPLASRSSGHGRASGTVSPAVPLSPTAAAASGISSSGATAGLGLSSVDFVTERMSDAIRAVGNA